MRCVVVPSFAPSSVGSFSRVRVAPRAQTDTNSSGDLSFSCAGKSALATALPVVSSSDSLAARPGLSACVRERARLACLCPRRLRFFGGERNAAASYYVLCRRDLWAGLARVLQSPPSGCVAGAADLPAAAVVRAGSSVCLSRRPR